MITSPHNTTILTPPSTSGESTTTPKIENPKIQNDRAWALLIACAIFITSFFLSSFRLPQTIDLQADEATYAIESIAFQRTGMTRWNGTPFFVHPPLFFAIEAAYFQALGIGSGPLYERLVNKPYLIGEALLPPDADIGDDSLLDAIMAGRYLSVFYGSAVAMLLFLMGNMLFNRWFGLLSALLFMLDPYVVRRNHFNMLEPLATLMALLMIFFYFRAVTRFNYLERHRNLFAMGVFFGLALLSKELALLYVPGLVVHALFFRRDVVVTQISPIRELISPMLLGFSIYALFPLWAALSGHFDVWWATKGWLFNRLSGVIRDTGISRPGTSATRSATSNLFDYWPSFLLLGLAGLLVAVFLYLYFRRGLRDWPAELLVSLIVGWYGSFLVIWRIGGVLNEQFFYFFMPLTCATVAYAIVAWPRLRAALSTQRRAGPGEIGVATSLLTTGNLTLPAANGHSSDGQTSAATGERARLPTSRAGGRFRRLVVPWVLGILLFNFFEYCLVDWTLRYVLSRDDSYAQVEGTLARTIPPGAGVVGRDLLDIYLLPKSHVYIATGIANAPGGLLPMDVAAREIPYVILSEQNLAHGYSGANQEFHDWVEAHGEQVVAFEGRLYSTSAYRMDYSKPTIDKYIGMDSLSYGKPATSSSAKDEVLYGPANAFDGWAETRWVSAGNKVEWLAVDLGEVKTIGRVELVWERSFAFNYELQVSNDGKEWTTVTGTGGGEGSYEIIETEATGRYVRLYMNHPATSAGYSLWEMSVYP